MNRSTPIAPMHRVDEFFRASARNVVFPFDFVPKRLSRFQSSNESESESTAAALFRFIRHT